MPRRCSICDHPERKAIDLVLAAGNQAMTETASLFSVSAQALARHKDAHLPAAMVKANAAAEATDADDLLAKVAALEAEAKSIGAEAQAAGDLRTALSAVRELVRMVELLAKLRGEIDDRPQVNLFVSSQWTVAMKVVMVALQDFPEARIAVADRLAEVDS